WRFAVPILATSEVLEGTPRLDHAWVEAPRREEVGLGRPPLAEEKQAEVAVRVGVVGVDLQRPLIGGRGAGGITLDRPEIAQVHPRVNVVGSEPKRLAGVEQGLVDSPLLCQDN